MLNSKIRPRAVVGYGVKIFHAILRITSPDHLVVLRMERKMARRFAKVSEEEIEEAFFYPSDLTNTKTAIP